MGEELIEAHIAFGNAFHPFEMFRAYRHILHGTLLQQIFYQQTIVFAIAVDSRENFMSKIKPKSDYPLKTLYPRAFQTGQNHLIYYDFTTVE